MAVISNAAIKEQSPRLENKVLFIETDALADTGDTIAVTLANHGASGIAGIQGSVHSTTDSIVIDEAPTTVVSAGVLTVTVGGSAANNLKRSYVIWLN